MPTIPQFPYREQFEQMFRYDGKVAIIAGGCGGIGSVISHGLAQLGAVAVIADHREEQACECAESIAKQGDQSHAIKFDITNPDSVTALVAETVKLFEKVDILINCVGMHIDKPAEDYNLDDWDRVTAVNQRGAFLLSQIAGRQMIRQGTGGKHIHITSVRSVLGIKRGYVAYCTTKGALNMMVKQLASEWAKYQITVNAVAPTFIRTELVKQYLEDREFYSGLVNRIPLGRVGEPIDVAGAVLYLAAPAADFITGHILLVDGGVTACQ
jgi:NAD(P)-dependent dehydrogenase (short-subunit alcohol dehydrogenase family)